MKKNLFSTAGCIRCQATISAAHLSWIRLLRRSRLSSFFKPRPAMFNFLTRAHSHKPLTAQSCQLPARGCPGLQHPQPGWGWAQPQPAASKTQDFHQVWVRLRVDLCRWAQPQSAARKTQDFRQVWVRCGFVQIWESHPRVVCCSLSAQQLLLSQGDSEHQEDSAVGLKCLLGLGREPRRSRMYWPSPQSSVAHSEGTQTALLGHPKPLEVQGRWC